MQYLPLLYRRDSEQDENTCTPTPDVLVETVTVIYLSFLKAIIPTWSLHQEDNSGLLRYMCCA